MSSETTRTLPATHAVRPQRADARRNRERVLSAARTIYAEHGREAQIDEIARTAGVGVGTVYRHFPTKEALAEAIAADHFERLAASAREGLEHGDAWRGFCEFMRRAAEMQANDLAVAEVMAAQPDAMREAAERRDDLHEAVAELVIRAQRAGALRADVVPEDVPMLLCGLGRATRVGSTGPTMSWERYLVIMLDGLRAPGATSLPNPPPGLFD
jgi:AcrR family transcriptional regulator